MATPLYTPRVNNNDDSVRLVKLLVKAGDAVRAGQFVAEVETDKANFTVEADCDGYVLGVVPELNHTIDVGSVLLWVGNTPEEPAPTVQSGVAEPAAVVAEPTLKAAQLLARHGLSAAQVRSSGPRLSVADVEAFLARRDGAATREEPASSRDGGRLPFAAGATEPLDPEARGMLRTVLWQRDEAVPGYIEIQYDAAPWQQAAAEYQKREGLLLNPLLALMAYRLVRFASANPRWNSTIVDDKRHVYHTVNLGFTIQSDRTLYLAVLSDATSLSCREFVDRLGGLQRSAIAHTLRVADLSGATMSFSSMARWNVSRHVPVLPPYTSLIVAHASTVNGAGILGATYDHRVLTGFDAVKAIEAVATPEEIE